MCLSEPDFHKAPSPDDFFERLPATVLIKKHGSKPVVPALLSLPRFQPTLLHMPRNQCLLRFCAIELIAMLLHVTIHALWTESGILRESVLRRLAL